MLVKCANPACCIPFRYSPGTRLFQVETLHSSEESNGARPPSSKGLELYWLCQSCFYIVLSSFEWDQESVTYHLPDGKGTRTITIIPLDDTLISPDSIGVK